VCAAHREDGLAILRPVDAVLRAILLQEGVHVTALHTTARYVVTPVIAQQLGQAGFIGFRFAQRRNEGVHGLFRCREGFLRRNQG